MVKKSIHQPCGCCHAISPTLPCHTPPNPYVALLLYCCPFLSQVYNDHFQASLYEAWHIVVQARLRMDIHSLLGQQSPADLVVRGDRYSRKVRAFSSAPSEISFEPQNAFQLVPGGYNRCDKTKTSVPI